MSGPEVAGEALLREKKSVESVYEVKMWIVGRPSDKRKEGCLVVDFCGNFFRPGVNSGGD